MNNDNIKGWSDIKPGMTVLATDGAYLLAYPARNGEVHYIPIPELYPEDALMGQIGAEIFHGDVRAVYSQEDELGNKVLLSGDDPNVPKPIEVTVGSLVSFYAKAMGLEPEDIMIRDEAASEEILGWCAEPVEEKKYYGD